VRYDFDVYLDRRNTDSLKGIIPMWVADMDLPAPQPVVEAIKPKLNTFDATMIVVSLVIGIGIFRTPAMVASAARTPFLFFLAWGLGGLISLLHPMGPVLRRRCKSSGKSVTLEDRSKKGRRHDQQGTGLGGAQPQGA
jgi:hypothetical protein